MSDERFDDATFSDVDGVGPRVYYTLTDNPDWQLGRTAKAVALVIETLVERELLDQGDVDRMLQHIVA